MNTNLAARFRSMVDSIRDSQSQRSKRQSERSNDVKSCRQATRDFISQTRKDLDRRARDARNARKHFVKELCGAVDSMRSATRTLTGEWRDQMGDMHECWAQLSGHGKGGRRAEKHESEPEPRGPRKPEPDASKKKSKD